MKPVNAQFCFECVGKKEKKKIFGGIPLNYNFWDEFQFKELTINQRQKEDKVYAEILNRIRIGLPDIEDIKKLSERVIKKDKSNDKIENAAMYYIELLEKYNNLICLLPTTQSVETFNSYVNKLMNINTYSIDAIDSNPNDKFKFKECNFKHKKNLKARKLKTNKTAGLETKLKIGNNSRIILRRNLDVSLGLCNGALGTIKDIVFDDLKPNFVKYLMIKFDKIEEIYKLDRVTADYEYQRNIYVSRSQFPISLAWALTIHKTQGLSLDAVMIDLGNEIFEPGMAYVALSRSKKLENVFLIEFNKSKLFCNSSSVLEYNRLRKLYLKNPVLIEKYNIIPEDNIKANSNNNSNLKRRFIREYINESDYSLNLVNEISNKKAKTLTEQNYNNNLSHTNYFLKLQNINNSCFANVIIQALLSIGNQFQNQVITMQLTK